MKNKFFKAISFLMAAAMVATSVNVTPLAANPDTESVSDNQIVVDADDDDVVVTDDIDIKDALCIPTMDKNSDTENYGYIHLDNISVEASNRTSVFRKEGTIPTKYDARNFNNVTPVKNQNPFGTCWAFAMVNAAESSVLANGLYDSGKYTSKEDAAKNYNLSERATAYNFFHREGLNDPKKNTLGDYVDIYHNDSNYDDCCYNIGGNNFMSTMSYLNWEGPIYEEKSPYDPLYTGKPVSSDLDLFFDSDIHVQDVRYFSLDNPDEIKQHIMEQGAVMMSFHAFSGSSPQGTSENIYNYYSDDSKANHAISIVGWDDNYSKDNFQDKGDSGTKTAMKPDNDGAWLMKNSWGTEYNGKPLFIDGYCWISYEDKSLCDVIGLICDDSYDSIYYHDGGSYPVAINASKYDFVEYANVFENNTGNAEKLQAVGFGTMTSDVDYEVQVILDPSASDPFSGTVEASAKGSYNTAGFYTIDLDKEVIVKPGQTFSVVVKTKDYEYILFDSSDDYGEFVTAAKTGTSLTKDGSGKIRDVSAENYTVRIKAYAGESYSLTDDCVITNLEEKYGYIAEPITPAISISSKDGVDFTSGKDYTVSYSDNVNVGTCTMTITGKGKLKGSVKKDFEITKAYAEVTAINRKIKQGTALPDFDYTETLLKQDAFTVEPVVTVVDKDGKEVNENSALGIYDIVLSAPKDTKGDKVYENYELKFNKGTFEITDKDVFYTVTFDTSKYEDLAEIEPITDIVSGTKIKEPEIKVPDGFVLRGWYKEAKCVHKWDFENNTVRNDVTLYPKITKISYSIVYDGNGGTCTIPAQENLILDKEVIVASTDGLDRPNYEFVEWNTSKDGKGTGFQPGDKFTAADIVKTEGQVVTLYAIWNANKVKVTLDANGGTVSKNAIDVVIDQPYGNLPTPARADYVFEGWYTEEINGSLVTNETIVKNPEAHTLYAHWKSVEIQVAVKQKFDAKTILKTGYTKVKYKVVSVDGAGKASITKKGILTGKKPGKVKVMAFVGNQEMDSKELTIVKPMFTLSPVLFTKSSQVVSGNQILNNVPNGAVVTWLKPVKSSVISLDAMNGEMRPNKSGKVKVTAQITSNGYSVKVPVTVRVKMPTLPLTVKVKSGKTKNIKIKNVPAGQNVTWTIEGTSVTKVLESNKGIKVQATGAGMSTIIATVDGDQYKCTVTVK